MTGNGRNFDPTLSYPQWSDDVRERFPRAFWSDPADAIQASLRTGSGLALEVGSIGVNWSDLARRITSIDAALEGAGIVRGDTVAVPGRNDLDCAIAVLALIATGRGAAIVNPFQPGAEFLASAHATCPAAILLPESDPALAAAGSTPLLVMTPTGHIISQGNHVTRRISTRVDRRLCLGTSGTTGKPKLINIAAPTLARAMHEIARFNVGFGDQRRENGTWPALIQYSPLAHVGGVLTLIRGAVQCRPVVMLGKFDASGWADIVEAHGLFTTGLPPTMMRMVLDAQISPDRIASLLSVWSGTAPAREDDWNTFFERYGLPILGNYGATEFCGAIAAWSLEDHRVFFSEKRQAVGRIDPQVASARIRNTNGTICQTFGTVGTLEVKVHRISGQWLATSDLASLDQEGFLTLHGRSDDAIIRGGFKLIPDKIAGVLMKHPAVREAVVLGISDQRLGQVPVAAVEIVSGSDITENELQAFVRNRLPAYFVPVAVKPLPSLPRTNSLKADRRAIRGLFHT